MEQNPPPDQIILPWLTDFAHFIGDRLELPNDQAKGLLREYLELTAEGFGQQPPTSPYAQRTRYPDIPNMNAQHAVHLQNQSPNSNQTMNLPNRPLAYSVPPSAYQEADVKEETAHPYNYMAATTSRATSQEPPFPDDQQLGNIRIADPDSSETGTPSAQSTYSNTNTIGSVAEYDPFWVQRSNVDPTRVEDFSSAMKFDTLLSAGVIKTGDVLNFRVSVENDGQTLDTEAHLKIIGRSLHPTTRHRCPDLSVALLSAPNTAYPIAKACRGTSAITTHLEKCNITVQGASWREIQVLRGQQALGSLWWVKQAFHLWRDMKDEEAQETGQYFRQRRAQGKGMEGATQFRGVFGVWRNGVFCPDENQARYRCRG